MKRSVTERLFAGLLALLLVFTGMPVSAFASEDTGLCPHHTVHLDCGYAEAVEGSECTHEHGEDCYEIVTVCTHEHGDCGYEAGEEPVPCDHVHGDCGYTEEEPYCEHLCGDGSCSYYEGSEDIPCGHVCSEEEGCITRQLNCTHIHDADCGYAEAVEAQPCGYECAVCAAEEASAEEVSAVAERISALPTVAQLRGLPYEEQISYEEQVLAAWEAYNALSEEQKAELPEAQAVLEELLAYLDALVPEVPEEIPGILTDVAVNPDYADVISVDDLLEHSPAEFAHSEEADLASVHYDNPVDAAAAIKEDFKNRVTDISVGYVFPIDMFTNEGLGAISNAILDEVFRHTGVPNEGDYLFRNYFGRSGSASFDSYGADGETYLATIHMTITYTTTAEQEAVVDQRVASILSQLNPSGSDYSKVKAVYDWICANITYDYDHLGDSDYKLQYSAYAGIVNGTCVCQGYASLLYRFCLEMGIDARYIRGFANGGNHGWNIVRIGSLYYNADSTWDAGDTRYSWFLVNDANFTDHTRRDEYLTESFYAEYPMGKYNYDPTATVSITQQPVSVSVGSGETATVSLQAQGKELSYKWYYADKGSSSFRQLSGVTGNAYSVTMDSSVAGRRVYCVVTDCYGNSVTSATVTLNAAAALKILQQPVSVAVYAGETATVTVEAEGEGLTYKWYFAEAGTDSFTYTSSFKSNSYFVEMNSYRNGRRLYCVISDAYGNSVTTDTVTISMKTPLKITRQPQSVEVEEGANAVVSIQAEGDGLTYKWYFAERGKDYFTLTNSFKGSSYTVQMNSARNGRRIYCVITDRYGNSVQTNTVTLSMTQQTELKILSQTGTLAGAVGEEVWYKVEAQGDGLTYQWYYKNSNHTQFYLTTSVVGDTYSIEMSAARAGRSVYCVITDQYGNSVTSDTVTFTKKTALKITQQPQSVEVAEGSNAVVSVKAEGDGLTYKWYFAERGKDYFTLTNSFKGSSYTVQMNSTRNGRRIYCVISDQYGNSVQTDTVTLSMAAKTTVEILSESCNDMGEDGEIVWFTVDAIGDGLTYQWYYKNKNHTQFYPTDSITGDTYAVEMSAARDGRSVYCVITDRYGNSLRSGTVTFTRKCQLKITQQPKSVEVEEGANAVVSIKAEGEGLTYQWYFAEAGKDTFTLTNSFKGSSYTVQMNSYRNGRRIYCVVTDMYGNQVQSDTVTLSMKSRTELKILTQSVCELGAQGETVWFQVEAEGDGLTYQWYYKNSNHTKFYPTSTVTGDTYSIEMSAARNGRSVYCVITDRYGNSVTSATVTFVMKTPLKITQQPQSVEAAEGANAVVSLKAEGDGLTYKWYFAERGKDTFTLTNTFKGSSYTVQMNSSRNGRRIYCVVSDRYGNSLKTDTVTISMEKITLSGSFGDDNQFTWALSSLGKLTITGSGALYKDLLYDHPWKPYMEQIKTAEIGTGITELCDNAFDGACNLTGIKLPDTLTYIGECAFDGCSSLLSVTIPKNVKMLGDSAFGGCSSLKSVVIPDGITEIPLYCFEGCAGLTSVTIPESVTDIFDTAFGGCISLKTLNLPDGLTSIDGFVFSGCTGLEEITIPDKVTSIGWYAFGNCTSLKSLVIPESMKFIGDCAFQDSSISEIRFCGDPPTFEGYALRGVTGKCLYPAENTKWTENVMLDYDGNITWIAY